MEIDIADYDAGYERSIMINTVFYPVEKIQRNITRMLSRCYAGRYSSLYTELLNTLDVLKIFPDNYYYTNSSEENIPTHFDVIKPLFSMFQQDLIL